MSEIDTMNRFHVAEVPSVSRERQSDKFRIMLLNNRLLSRDDALNLAAYLVLLAESSGEGPSFEEYLAAIGAA